MPLQLLPSWLQSFGGKTEEEKAEGLKQTLAAAQTRKPSRSAPRVSLLRRQQRWVHAYMDVTLGSLLVSWVYAGEKLYGFRYKSPNGPRETGWHGPGAKKHGPSPVRPGLGPARAWPGPQPCLCLGRKVSP